MPGVAPRPNNKAKKIAQAILGTPQNQPQRRKPRKQQEEIKDPNMMGLSTLSKT